MCKNAATACSSSERIPWRVWHGMAKSELINNSTPCVHVLEPKRCDISFWSGRRIELIGHIRFWIRIYFQAHIENLSDLARQDSALGFAYKMDRAVQNSKGQQSSKKETCIISSKGTSRFPSFSLYVHPAFLFFFCCRICFTNLQFV